jgi:hypothetical protein
MKFTENSTRSRALHFETNDAIPVSHLHNSLLRDRTTHDEIPHSSRKFVFLAISGHKGVPMIVVDIALAEEASIWTNPNLAPRISFFQFGNDFFW